MKKAFSLVELSIVLVILGLLVGGILAGQSLIRASELRKVTGSVDKYKTAIFAFRDKYRNFPGDMPNASSFWPSETYGGSATSGYPVNGNGNGNGLISDFTQGESIESAWVWRQLVLAGMIEGKYDPTAAFTGRSAIILGSDVPSDLGGRGGYLVTYESSFGAHQIRFAGLSHQNLANNQMKGGVLKPEEAWNIDRKIDDGFASTMKVRGADSNDAAGAAVTPACLSAGDYAIGQSTLTCRIGFLF